MTWPTNRIPDDPDLTVRQVDAYWSGEWLGDVAPSLEYEPEDVGEGEQKRRDGLVTTPGASVSRTAPSPTNVGPGEVVRGRRQPPVPTIVDRDLQELSRILRRQMLELARQGVRLPDSILQDIEPKGAYL